MEYTVKDLVRSNIISTTKRTVNVRASLLNAAGGNELDYVPQQEILNILTEILSTEKVLIYLITIEGKPRELKRLNNIQSKIVTIKLDDGNGYIEDTIKITLN